MSTIYKEAWSSAEGADTYERNRPGYAEAAVARLIHEFSIGPTSRIVELGAGTGKLTRQLLPCGADIIAVEPLEGMRSQLARTVPEVSIVSGSAEQTGMDDTSVDAIFCAQAWHWFDGPRALTESRRILKPLGGLGLLWNEYDRIVPWVNEYADIRDRYARTSESRPTGTWRKPFDEALDTWTPLQGEAFPHVTTSSRAQVIGRMLSSSVLAVLPDSEKLLVAREIEQILDSRTETDNTDEIEVPYITDVFWTRMR